MRATCLVLIGLCVADALRTPTHVLNLGAPRRAALPGPARLVSPRAVTAEEEVPTSGLSEDAKALLGKGKTPAPFKRLMAANRAEIAVRIMRAATELNMATVAIYGYEDRFSQHRWGADQSFLLEKKTPNAPAVASYLDIEQIIRIAKDKQVDAIHPGYGFLSESPAFAQACQDAGITFVGPTVANLKTFADKTTARVAAIAAGVPVVPGTDEPVISVAKAQEFVDEYGLPVIIKAAMGGGGKGMRVVRKISDLAPFFESASSEAKAAFGDGSVFLERYVERPRHIEVQIIGDGKGNAVHLWERDCSVQRRYQKVIEIAPAWSLDMALRKQLHADALRLMKGANYLNAGTVEFLVDAEGRYYFIEVNPRIQVEHTVTEEVTGIDLVQAQMRIASGASLEDVGLVQDRISARGIAVQCRVTTENPERNFAPDTGTLSVYRHSAGYGMRQDGIGYSGMTVTPYYDSLLVKYTARGATWEEVNRRMRRALQEARIRGVQTNIPFLLNVLTHPTFEKGIVTTGFIDDHPELTKFTGRKWDFASASQTDMEKVLQVEKLIRYMANLAVNGHPSELGANPARLTNSHAAVPAPSTHLLPKEEGVIHGKPGGWRKILLEQGPDGYAKAVREHKGLLIMDTTWRDAHQSLLATRMRTADIVKAAPYTNAALSNAFSLEMWGGATFDVAMRFLHESPWTRLEKLRALTPDVPFQMLLRGANAVGYTNYPDNLVYKFCKEAKDAGIDIFRVFDSLNYIDNLKLGIEAAKAAGGFVEAAICYTGDISDPKKGKYTLDYYLDYAKQLAELGVHSIAIKDMAGLLKPRAATMLVSALRKELPDMPIHVHTHDTAGSGLASMLAAAEAGADIVDVAIDALSGLTSQPSMGALAAVTQGTDLSIGVTVDALEPLNAYWEQVRTMYAPFESGQLSGSSDVYKNEIPGGQYTNLLFQASQLGLGDRWVEVKRKYAQANLLLGDIPKVTPSSKVVGDLAQFMVAQKLEPDQVLSQAESLAFPDSVVSYLQGAIGVPPGGFPEPLRSKVLAGRALPDGSKMYAGRPGATMPDYDFESAKAALLPKYPSISDQDVLAYALYPQVFRDWQDHRAVYGDVGELATELFLNPMAVGDEVELQAAEGRSFIVKLVSKGEPDENGLREVIMELNGERWFVPVTDTSVVSTSKREKAPSDDRGSVGAPMPGVVVDVKVKAGDEIREGEPLVVLSAMKMETVIPAPASGTISRLLVTAGDKVEGNDLLAQINIVK